MTTKTLETTLERDGFIGRFYYAAQPSDTTMLVLIGSHGGIALAETVFSYPGIGSAVTAAALNADAPLLIALAVFSALFVFAGNFIANVLYGIVDPRLKEGGYRA